MRLTQKTNEFLIWFGKYRNASLCTVESYGTAFAQFQGWLVTNGKSDDIRQFTPDNVQAFAEALALSGVKPVTVRIRLTALGTFAEWAMRQKDPATEKYILAENPLLRVERPKRGKPNTTFLYGHEARALLTLECGEHKALARDFFFDTGVRVSEACDANVGALWDDGTTTYVRVRLKGGSERNIPLGAEYADRLKASLKGRATEPKQTDPLLVNSAGHRWTRSALKQMIRGLGEKAGVTRTIVGPHMLRHTYNVVARAVAGLDVNVRAELLNHAGTSTLQRYDHLIAGETQDARDQVRDAMKKYTEGGK